MRESTLQKWAVRVDERRNRPYNKYLPSAPGGAMYAVIRSGSKQYRVSPGNTVKVETLAGKVGGKITFGDVLAVGTDEKKLLTGPDAAKAKVVGKIVSQGRHPKITVLKFKTCGQYKISRGHRQNYTAVEVSGIEL
jgi:large subunit ribosomal protein L21